MDYNSCFQMRLLAHILQLLQLFLVNKYEFRVTYDLDFSWHLLQIGFIVMQ